LLVLGCRHHPGRRRRLGQRSQLVAAGPEFIDVGVEVTLGQRGGIACPGIDLVECGQYLTDIRRIATGRTQYE
jgi:hypothetical protein